MTTFVDTSALYAILAEDDPSHAAAMRWIDEVADGKDERLRTHSYVVAEALSLVHARLGGAAARALIESVLPACEVRFVDEQIHARAVSAYLAALGSNQPSFVDRVSFETMREERLRRAFSFDRDFSREGFEVVP